MDLEKDKVVAVIQARMNSSRLPGKVLMDIWGRPMLEHIVRRLKRANLINQIVIATTGNEDDQAIVDIAARLEVVAVRGSEEDVLGRFLFAAQQVEADVIVRICGDQPLIDPKVVDHIIAVYYQEKADCATNLLKKTYPFGIHADVFSRRVLEEASRQAKESYQREHVMPFIYEHPEQFKLVSVEIEGPCARPDLRLVVDTKEDLKLIREVYERLGKINPYFGLEEIMNLFQREPELAEINCHIEQRAVKPTQM